MTELKISTSIIDDSVVITAHLESTDGFPLDIFVFANTGTGIGDYQGVCTLGEYVKYTTFTGDNIPLFGNMFLKYTIATIKVPFDRDPIPIKNKLVQDVKNFKAALTTFNQETETIPI